MKIQARYVRVGDRYHSPSGSWCRAERVEPHLTSADNRPGVLIAADSGVLRYYYANEMLPVRGIDEAELAMRMLAS